MTLPACITIEEPAAGYRVLVIRHPAACARVAFNGAHVMEWTPAGQAPVLYLSPQAVIELGKPIRGGIPICWPWFNAHPTDPAKPMHGFARIRAWQLVEAAATEAGASLAFSLTSSEETMTLWPHAFQLRLELSIGSALEARLTTENTGDTAFSLREALHTYLSVGDIHATTVSGLADSAYLDTVGTPAMRHQQGDIAIDREVDRQYGSAGAVRVTDRALDRTLIIEKEGSATTVVWNPWIEKSKRLADLPDDAYLQFLCIEAANAGNAAVAVKPGGSHRIATRVSVA